MGHLTDKAAEWVYFSDHNLDKDCAGYTTRPVFYNSLDDVTARRLLTTDNIHVNLRDGRIHKLANLRLRTALKKGYFFVEIQISNQDWLKYLRAFTMINRNLGMFDEKRNSVVFSYAHWFPGQVPTHADGLPQLLKFLLVSSKEEKEINVISHFLDVYLLTNKGI